jgi:hypothetical protein
LTVAGVRGRTPAFFNFGAIVAETPRKGIEGLAFRECQSANWMYHIAGCIFAKARMFFALPYIFCTRSHTLLVNGVVRGDQGTSGRHGHGGVVKHFSITDWADFVRGIVTPEQKASMQKHLDEDCSRCRETAGMLASIAAFVRRETSYEPPADSLSVARSYLAPFKLAASRSRLLQMAKRTFDSFQSPAIAGVRGSDAVSQQLMYQCGNVFIDLRLEPKPDTRSVILAGQVLNSGEPGGGCMGGVPVSLLSQESPWLETTTNHLGEFHFSFPPGRQLKLLFGTEGNAVLVLLPDAGLA